jgi:dihydropteroate synthase
VDTDKPEVAKAALDAGAQMINDISGLRDSRMAKLAARYKSAVVIMHMLGKPVNMQRMAHYRCLIEDISNHLKKAVEAAQEAGVRPEKIVIDPGIGFAKTKEDNFTIIRHLEAFKALGKPILVGPSRKNFIAKTLGENPASLDLGTACVCLMAAERGAHIVRVHDVKTAGQSLKIMEAVKNSHA